MKAHIGVDMTGLVHTVVGTAANVHDVTQAYALLHGDAAGLIRPSLNLCSRCGFYETHIVG